MPKQKILLVDDDANLVRALSLRLAAHGFETLVAMDGYSAVANTLKERPDLIILDLGLPAGDGFSVLERLRVNPKLMSLPVIVLSARDPLGSEERALKAGATAYFQKPVDNEELLNAIRASLPAAAQTASV